MYELLYVPVLVFLIYTAINLIAYRIQERFIFRPEKLPQDFQYRYDFPFRERFFEVTEGVRINGLQFYAHEPGGSQQAKGLVIYFHGNSRSIKGWGKFSVDFTRHGYDVLMIDYRGFGKSTGRRSEKNLKSDAQLVYEELVREYPEHKIIVYGRSIGSGFATKLASANHPRMLVLDAPYYSFARLARRFLPFLPMPWILRYPLRTHTWIKYVRCPIRIIHGTKDRLIPFKNSVDLAAIQPHLTVLYPIIGGRHNNLPSFPTYHETLEKILAEAETLPTDYMARHNQHLF